MMLNTESCGELNFKTANLGDKRRTQRLVHTVDLMCRRPGGALPQKLNDPKDLKAFYRLMDCEEVTHEAILDPHREATKRKIAMTSGPVLILHDATELDFTTHLSLTEELGQIGNGHRRGYIVQNSLAVDANSRAVLGLMNQVLHHRVQVPKGETLAEKRNRESRESLLWLQGAAPLPSDWNVIDVCDQGADTFEFLEHEVNSGRRFVIRAAYDRGIVIGHGPLAASETSCLRTYARTLPAQGTWTLQVSSKVEKKSPNKKGKKKTVKRKKRTATLSVSFAPVQIKPPTKKNGNHGNDPLTVWVIRVWEENPPKGQERLEWFLLTNEPVHDYKDAYGVVGWYECRWIVEEYHKAKKTGCQIESPQFTKEERLQPAIALLSIVALTLLNLRDASRCPEASQRKAAEILSEDYVAVLSSWRHGKIHLDWTIKEFFYALARLGGHQNRKHDKQPGWRELQAMVCGYNAMKQNNCG